MKKSRFSETQIVGILKQHEQVFKTPTPFSGCSASIPVSAEMSLRLRIKIQC